MKRPFCILIGASAGGVTAIQSILRNLSREVTAPIVVVQHLPASSRVDLRTVYPAPPGYRIIEAEDKMPLEPRSVYMAPPDYHFMIERDYSIALGQDDPVHFSRPSIDVCFESAAISLRDKAIGLLLTGANADGARGLQEISRHGGVTIVQDPGDAEFATMPEAALALFDPSKILRLEEIPAFLASSLSKQTTVSAGARS